MKNILKIKVKKLFKDKKLNPNSIRLILNKNLDIKLELEQEFNSNPNKYISIGKLVIAICNNIKFKHCIVCNKELNYDRSVANSSFCSNKCKLSKEGNPFANKNIQKKIKQKYIEKYGVDNPAKSIEIKNKIKETCLKKYGVENPYQAKEFKEKAKLSLINHYQTDNIYKNKELREKALNNKKINVYNKIINHYKGIIEPAFSIDEYQGTGKKYNWKCCKCGHIFNATYDNGIINSRCFKCYPRIYTYTSTYEKELINFIKQFGFNIIETDREIIKPYELDIVIPEKKIAIEFNGMYWHSTMNQKNPKYHLEKTELAEKVGYRLIHIFEYDWIKPDKQQILKGKIKALLNIDQKSIYARKCIIKEISIKDKNNFLNLYHIQGEDKSKVKLGLFYENELVGVMTFGKPRFNKKYDWELIRYATKAGYRVIGGAGKLLNYFRKNWTGSIVTYADRKYSIGNMYEKIGFKFESNTDPNYIWTNGIQVFNRYQTQKNRLINILGDKYDPNKSEIENMSNNGYYQIFDSGNKIYSLI